MAASYTDIKRLGFAATSFDMDQSEFETFVGGLITNVSDDLKERLGVKYSEPGMAKPVKNAEIYQTAADLVDYKITLLIDSQTADGDPPDTKLQTQLKKNFEEKAEFWVLKVLNGRKTDSKGYSGGVVIT